MEKGQTCRMAIEDISNEGQGIGRIDGMAVFVADVVLGDLVEVEITKLKKTYAFARLLEVVTPSEYRIEPFCQYAGQCGGCNLATTSYEGQLLLKEKQVRDKLTRLAGIENPKINPIIAMEKPLRYRNKAQMPIDCGGIITRKGGIVENLGECSIGFYKARSHEVVNCDQCLIQAPPAEAAAGALRQFMIEDNITAYDPKWEKGLMRHLIVKTAFGTGEVMVILVVNGRGIPNGEKLVTMLDDAISQIPPREDGVQYSLESVVLNVNKKKNSEIMGTQCMTIAGKPTILDRSVGMDFEISPLSFYQVNPTQTEKLYKKALEYANLSGDETVLDLYCGVGAIGLLCAKEMAQKGGQGQVIGIESVKGAVLDANRNAVINGIVNARYVCGKAEEVLPKLLFGEEEAELGLDADLELEAEAENLVEAGTEEEGESQGDLEAYRSDWCSITENGEIEPNVVILDPPRAGCAPELLKAIAAAAPERIVYVSCDPATLARDIKILANPEDGARYELMEATPVDMFGWSGHVESVVLMSRKDK